MYKQVFWQKYINTEADLQKYPYKKVFQKYAAILQENTSSIVKRGYQDNFKFVDFFLRKDFARTKRFTKQKIKHTLNN